MFLSPETTQGSSLGFREGASRVLRKRNIDVARAGATPDRVPSAEVR
jgi:hypothetical protein